MCISLKLSHTNKISLYCDDSSYTVTQFSKLPNIQYTWKSVPIIIALCANQNSFIRGQTLKSRSNWRSSRLACMAVDHVRAFDFTTSDSWGGLGCGAYKQHKHNILLHRLACDKAVKSELWGNDQILKTVTRKLEEWRKHHLSLFITCDLLLLAQRSLT